MYIPLGNTRYWLAADEFVLSPPFCGQISKCSFMYLLKLSTNVDFSSDPFDTPLGKKQNFLEGSLERPRNGTRSEKRWMNTSYRRFNGQLNLVEKYVRPVRFSKANRYNLVFFKFCIDYSFGSKYLGFPTEMNILWRCNPFHLIPKLEISLLPKPEDATSPVAFST